MRINTTGNLKRVPKNQIGDRLTRICFLLLLLWVVLPGLPICQADVSCPDHCPEGTCIDRSHGFECPKAATWNGDVEIVSVSNFGTGSTIEVTVDQCSPKRGDLGQAWAFIKDKGTCTPFCGICEEPNDIKNCTTGSYYYVVVKINGDAKTFKNFFSSVNFPTWGGAGISTANVEEANCDFSMNSMVFLADPCTPLAAPVRITCVPFNLEGFTAGANFSYTIQWYQ